MQHRVVLYTEDMEPITVLQLTEFARQALLERAYVILPITGPIDYLMPHPDDQQTQELRQVVIYAERLYRKGKIHHMLFTKNEESALLLKAAFLPGQQSALNEREVQGIAKGFLAALESLHPGPAF